MTVWSVVVAFVGAANAFRRRPCLAGLAPAQVQAGAVAALVAYVLLALAGASVRDALDVSAPNARIAAGLVLVAVGLHAVVAGLPRPAEPIEARTAWLVPVLFPVLLRPDLALVALAADGAGDVVSVACAAAAGLATVVLWWALRRPSGATWPLARGLGAVLGAALVLAAVRLTIDGVFAL